MKRYTRDLLGAVLAVQRPPCDPRERSGLRAIDAFYNLRDVWLDHRPADGGKRNYGYPSPDHVLLVCQGEIARHHGVEAVPFGSVEQLTVFQTGQPEIGGCERFVVAKIRPQIVRYVFVEEDFQCCSWALCECANARSARIVVTASVRKLP